MERRNCFGAKLAGCLFIELGNVRPGAGRKKNREAYQAIDMRRSGARMRQLFLEAGYDVKEIQRFLHLSCPQPIYRWMKGQMLPTVDHLFMLSKLLGIHMEDFLIEKKPEEMDEVFIAYRSMALYFRNVNVLAAK